MNGVMFIFVALSLILTRWLSDGNHNKLCSINNAHMYGFKEEKTILFHLRK